MASEQPEHPPGLTRSQLRLALLIAIGLTLVVTSTARGQAAPAEEETDTDLQPLPAKHAVSGRPGTDLYTHPTSIPSAPPGGDASRSARAACCSQ